MNTPNNISHFLRCLFEAWNTAGITYLVLRNYEELPDQVGNDVDVLVDPGQIGEVKAVLQRVSEENRWRMHNVGEFACLSLFFHHEDTLEQLHLDLMLGLNWRAFRFIDEQDMLGKCLDFRGFHIPHPAHEAAVNLLTRLIYGGYVKEKYREGIQLQASGDAAVMTAALEPWLGKTTTAKMVTWSAQGEWNRIESLAGSVRRHVIWENLKDGARLVPALWHDAWRFFRRVWSKPGVSIVFFGPDGCGKTSVAGGLAEALSKTFYPEKSLHCHWKPIREKGEGAAPTVDPHALPRRNGILSAVYFAYHYLPFIWGWLLHVQPALFRNGLVIIDRYYYDFFIDPRRYRLNLPHWIIRLGYVFIKKPDLVFCLDADPEVLQARKHEVTFDECKRQREAYRLMAETLPNGHVMDASQPLEHVVREVQAVVLGYMAARTAKRLSRR